MAVKDHLAILFGDIAGSMRLYQDLGDLEASVVVARCVQAMSRAVHHHGGTVLRVIGDEVLAISNTTDIAVNAAIAMQDAITALGPELGRKLAIRIGMHVGEVLRSEGELYGDAVNVAARMASQAKAGEILLTGTAARAITGECSATARHIGWIAIKGHINPVELCEIVWRSTDATMMGHAPLDTPVRRDQSRMALHRADRRVVLTERRGSVTFGREDENDIVILGGKVSRQHGFVEMRNGRVVLVDQSSNGTYIVPYDMAPTEKAAFLHRDSMMLTGAGVLGLGEDPRGNPGWALFYAATD